MVSLELEKVYRCDRNLRVNDKKHLRVHCIFSHISAVRDYMPADALCPDREYHRRTCFWRENSKARGREEERHMWGLKMTHLRYLWEFICGTKFQGRKNRKDAFSLAILEFSLLAMHKSDNNATLFNQIIKLESPISPIFSPVLLFAFQWPL